MDSKHELAEGRQMRGPGGRQARELTGRGRGRRGRERTGGPGGGRAREMTWRLGDDGPGAHGRAGGVDGPGADGRAGGRRAGSGRGRAGGTTGQEQGRLSWAGMTRAVLLLKGQMWGRDGEYWCGRALNVKQRSLGFVARGDGARVCLKRGQ